MPGVKALRRIQIGQESTGTPGTAVAATAVLRLNGTLEDQRKVVFPEEEVGLMGGADRQYIASLGGAITTEGEATFEQIGYILGAGVQDSTATTDTGSGYVYTYTLATTAQNFPFTYTIEGGDDQEAEEVEYSFVKEFTLSGTAGEAWKVSANWQGRQVSTSTFTTSSDAPLTDVEEILFSKTKLYIDEITDAIGTTLKSNTLIGAELKVTTGFTPIPPTNGNLYFASIKQTAPEVVLTVTFEHDGTSTAEKSKWRAGTARQIRLIATGNTLASGGTYTTKTFIINLAGKWEKFDKIDEMDGNDIVKGTFRARYNSTAALFGNFVVVNELSTLP